MHELNAPKTLFVSPPKCASVVFQLILCCTQWWNTHRLFSFMTYFLRPLQNKSFWSLECTFQLATLVWTQQWQNLQSDEQLNPPSPTSCCRDIMVPGGEGNTTLNPCELLTCNQFWSMLSLLWRRNTCLKHTLTLGPKLVCIVTPLSLRVQRQTSFCWDNPKEQIQDAVHSNLRTQCQVTYTQDVGGVAGPVQSANP